MNDKDLSISAQRTVEPLLTAELFRPFARTAGYALRGARPRIRAKLQRRTPGNSQPPIFLIGCGRSGTTLLGSFFAAHPAVKYLYEPYDLWAAVEPMTDFLQLYSRGERHCMLNEELVTATAQRRSRYLICAPPGFTIIENSPISAMRIGYLRAIWPEVRFVHVMRDGIDVVRSIERLAMTRKKMAFRPPLSGWWGVGDAKWSALEADGSAADYYTDEVSQLATHAQRGAYEWLVSTHEVEAWRGRLGSTLVELRYQDLIDQPQKTLSALMDSLSLTCPEEWLQLAAAQVRPVKSRSQGYSLKLPSRICAAFNEFQESFDFKGRATPLRSTSAIQRPEVVESPASKSYVRQHTNRSRSIQVRCLTSMPEARAFAGEWADFAENAGARNPFTHPDWLMPWAARFIRPGEQIWLLTVRRRGRLVGVAPFYRRSWGSGLVHCIQLWGTGRNCGLIELPQLLLDPEEARATARTLVAWLCSEASGWDWATVPLEDSLWLEPEWLPRSGKVTVLTKAVRASVVLPITVGKPPPIKRNARESLRRARNRLDRAFPGQWSVSRAVNRADLEHALPDLVALHAERSRLPGKKRHPNALSKNVERSFLRDSVIASAERDAVCLYRLLVEGQAIAALLTLRTRDCTYILLSGMTSWSWEFSPVTLLQGYAIEDAVTLGHSWVNMSTGPDTAKMRWSENLVMSPEFILSPGRVRSRAAFATYWQLSAAAELVRERNRHTLPPSS